MVSKRVEEARKLIAGTIGAEASEIYLLVGEVKVTTGLLKNND